MLLHELWKSIDRTFLVGVVVNFRHDHLEALTDDMTAGSDYLPLGALAVEFEKVERVSRFMQPLAESHNFNPGSVGMLRGIRAAVAVNARSAGAATLQLDRNLALRSPSGGVDWHDTFAVIQAQVKI